MSDNHAVTSMEALEALYGTPPERSIAKETQMLTPAYRKWLERAPFVAIASTGPGGLDCSPRGDAVGQLLRVIDDKTIAIPDRRGNNRLDTLRNIVEDPRIALLFLIPGINDTLRVNGRATLTTDPEMIESFAVGDKRPATIILVHIDAVYFQCARAILRSDLWSPEALAARKDVPTTGDMIRAAASDFDATGYDTNQTARQKATLY